MLASKSGKLTKVLVEQWLKDVYCKLVPDYSVLLLDSWTGQNEQNINASFPNDKVVNVKTIPKGATAFVQPLDVFGFRVWKQFVRFVYDLILLENCDINIHLRNNLLKIQSLTHNQLSSPRFRNMWKYSWYKCGYVNVRPRHFENPVDFCFKSDSIERKCSICENDSAVRCSWCTKCLCLVDFFVNNHYCTNYNE